MKRTALSILLGAQVLASAAGWGPAGDCAEPLPHPANEGGVTQPQYRLPPPVQVELPPSPLVSGVVTPEANCPACEQAPACPSGPVGRLWHCRVKPALQASHWGYPEQFCIRPFGSYTRAAVVAQVQNGIAAQLTLYQFDFVAPDGQPSAELNPTGRLRLEKLSELMPLTMCPLVIEVNEQDPTLNAARRAYVAALLQQAFANFPDDRVVVGRPLARGLAAQEAVLIHGNVQNQVQTMGSMPSYSGGKMESFSGAPGGSGASGAASSR